MPHDHRSAVAGFYDTHPINEDEILRKVEARGLDLDHLTENDLTDFDQDHYGGVETVDALAVAAKISRDQHVLDVCCGMGGPARRLASTIGCRVTGLDLTLSRIEGAKRLTARVRLNDLVDFQQGDATCMPFRDATFDALISQEAWCHIPEKASLIAESARVLKPGGSFAFTDIVVTGELPAEDEERLAKGMQIPLPATVGQYEALLSDSGLAIRTVHDLSSEWRQILIARLEMYRSLRDTTVAKFGEERFLEYDRAYSHFVGLFTRGKLGGCRVGGHKPSK